MEQSHGEVNSTEMDIEKTQEQMMMDDEEYARLLQNEFLQELFLEQQQEEERQKEIRRLENEENARIRLQQDMEYLECLNVIPKNNRNIENTENVIIPQIPPLPETSIIEDIAEHEFFKPPERFICPLSNKIMDIPIRDYEDNICYDKKTLLQYLKENNNKNHIGKLIDKQNLITDNNLKTEIFLWLREHPEYK